MSQEVNQQQSDSKLLAFVNTRLDGIHRINIYGTPQGLKRLPVELIKQAEADQSHLGDYDTVHTHYRSTHPNAILASSSNEVVIGRLDLWDGEIADWASKRIELGNVAREVGESISQAIPFPKILAEVESRPGMFLRCVTYDSVAALIQGYDLATRSLFLDGFKTWLCSRTPHGHNMVWSVLLLFIAFPESKTPWQELGLPSSEEHAIRTLFSCLRDFCDAGRRDITAAPRKARLRFPVEFDPIFSDKGYWPYSIVELPDGNCYSVYFAQICSFDLPSMHDPYFAPPGLIVVPEVTIANMENAVEELYESGKFFPFLNPLDPNKLRSGALDDWPPIP